MIKNTFFLSLCITSYGYSAGALDDGAMRETAGMVTLVDANNMGYCCSGWSFGRRLPRIETPLIDIVGYQPSAIEKKLLKTLKSKISKRVDFSDEILELLEDAAKNGHKAIVAYLLHPDSGLTLRPSQRQVDLTLLQAVTSRQHAIFSYLLNPASPITIRPDQWGVNDALYDSTQHGNQVFFEYVLNPESAIIIRPDQTGVNRAFRMDSSRSNKAFLEYVLNPASVMTTRPDQNAINNILLRAALFNEIDIYRRLLNPESPLSIQPDQNGINGVLESEILHGNKPFVEYLLNPESPIRIKLDQKTIDDGLYKAVQKNHEDITKTLLNPATVKHPTQSGVNDALRCAFRNAQRNIFNYLLDPTSPLSIRPDQTIISSVLVEAVYNDNDDIVKFLFNPESPMVVRPSQEDVNKVLYSALKREDTALAMYLLNSESPISIRPNHDGVDNALRQASDDGKENIVRFLLNPESTLAIRPTPEAINGSYHNVYWRGQLRANIRILLEAHVPAEQLIRPAIQAAAVAVGQEIIYDEFRLMQDAYTTLISDPRSSEIIDRYLPEPESTNAAFSEASREFQNDLASLLSGSSLATNLKFQIKMALRSLKLLNGDTSIERYAASPLESYQTRYYQYMPNIRQLFVLAYNLLKPKNRTDFVKDWMASTLSNEDVWNRWIAPFRDKFEAARESDVGMALSADRDYLNSHFIAFIVNSLEGRTPEKLMTADMARRILNLKNHYTVHMKDSLMPLIEALFMIMRGHNNEGRLFDPQEPNNPACADGAYLNILKAITQTPAIADVAASKLVDVEITHCDVLPEAGGVAVGNL